jgi:hypothetical protein
VVSLKVEGDRILVLGDTYEIRDHLKRIGFRWDPAKKAWYTSASIGIDTVKAQLERIPEVIVK